MGCVNRCLRAFASLHAPENKADMIFPARTRLPAARPGRLKQIQFEQSLGFRAGGRLVPFYFAGSPAYKDAMLSMIALP